MTNPVKTVLVVDDEPMVEEVIGTLVAGQGCHYVSYTNSKRALAYFEKHHANVILAMIDLTMPGINGLELAEELHRITPALPVTFLTGHLVDELEVKKHGIHNIVQKPVTKAEFIEALSQTIRSCVVSEEAG
jgi:two-component system, cell cycle sensor histidine kinase and response regulator CckA